MIIGVIPARFASSRFPGKLLADLSGKPVLQWTWERACKAVSLNKVVIAAGDDKIVAAARGFGAEVEEVFQNFTSGSDRIAEVARRLVETGTEVEIAVNIQGDEPMLEPEVIDLTVETLKNDPEAGVATPVTPIRTPKEFFDKSVVKAVLDQKGRALYFSRSAIPDGFNFKHNVAFRHIGLYAYRWSVLREYSQSPRSELEKCERLEQLRLLHHGVKIATVEVETASVGIDCEEDLKELAGIIGEVGDD